MVHGRSAEAAGAASQAGTAPTVAGDEGWRLDPHSPGPEAPARLPLTPLEAERMRCERGIWYHDDRERFFARLHKFLMFCVIVLGASAGADVTQALGWFDAKYLGIAAAFIGAADIAWDIAGKARLHAMLKRDAVTILERLENGDDIQTVRLAIARSFADEPPMMHAVNAMAYNAVQRAHDRGEHTCMQVTPWQRRIRNLWAFNSEDFPDKPVPRTTNAPKVKS